MANVVLLALLVGIIFVQALIIRRAEDPIPLWESGWWFLAYFVIGFSDMAVFEGGFLKRAGRSTLATLALGIGWLASLVLIGRVLTIPHG